MARQIDKPICTNPGCHWKQGHLTKNATSAHCSHLLHDVGWSLLYRIALMTSTTWDRALRLLRSPTYNGAMPSRIAFIISSMHDGILLIALLASSLRQEMSRLPRIARILFLDRALRLFGFFGSLPESFGFLFPSPIWVRRFFIKLIVWFSSLISRLGWEGFHQVNQVKLSPS